MKNCVPATLSWANDSIAERHKELDCISLEGEFPRPELQHFSKTYLEDIQIFCSQAGLLL